MIPSPLPPALADVSRETLQKLEAFATLIHKWQPSLNLISKDSLAQLWTRHIADSLQLLPHLGDEAACAIYDLGSGGGFPAIPLAIATGRSFHLVESDQRKAIFLREVARQLDLPLTIHAQRIEAMPPPTPKCELLIARACASLTQLLAWSAPLLSPDGKCLFPKGALYRKEIEDALAQWHFEYHAIPSNTDPEAAIIAITQLRKRAK